MEQIVHQLQDMTYLSWAKTRNSSGTAGSFLKAYDEDAEGKTYYKLSNYDTFHGVTGHESVNEIIADRLLSILDIPHLSYQLIHADILVDSASLRSDSGILLEIIDNDDPNGRGMHMGPETVMDVPPGGFPGGGPGDPVKEQMEKGGPGGPGGRPGGPGGRPGGWGGGRR